MTDPFLKSIFLKNGATSDWAVDGSVTPVEYSVGVPSGFSQFIVHRALLYMSDGSGFRAEYFAGLGAALSNGCDFEFVNDGTTYDMLDGISITHNGDFGRMAYDVSLKTWGAGDDIILARWSFDKFGGPIRLAGANDKFVWRVNDNLSAITEATICVQGEVRV